MPPATTDRPTKVLVVDDDPFVRATTGTMLRSRGFEILQAGDGRQGLDAFLAHDPDLVLVDLKMPVMDGLELLSRVAEASPRTPVLVISGEGGLDEAVEALRRGAWDYLVKPIVSATVLHHAVDKALERAALLRENEDYRENLERQVEQRTLELQKANRELEHQFLKQQKLAVIGTLAGGMAHDFNNILSSIVFSTELIREAAVGGDAPDQEDLERILRVCQRGTSLIRSVLHFTGRMHEEFSQFPIRETMVETLEIIRGTAPSHIDIQVSLGRNLGSLFGDPVHLQQILMNLTTNAVHALAGTPGPRIEITAESEPGAASDLLVTDPDSWLTVVTVSDNGPGIAEEDMPRLCEPFFTTKAPGEGTGLGLFVTQKIVKSLRGKLLFSRNGHGGTTVRVCLPTIPSQDAGTAGEGEAPLVRGYGERILVIEADPEVRAAVGSCLSRLDYRVLPAESLDRGLEILRENPAGLDLVLAEDGPAGRLEELVAAVERVNPGIRILLITASPTPRPALGSGSVCRTVSKPLDMPALGLALRHCLRPADRNFE
jgi:signal transduction histidine kinase